ncbi:MAG: 23S rRNA (adenine(2503)-C(2))-methyltransferase RlmN, partial [Bacilli bacterium]
ILEEIKKYFLNINEEKYIASQIFDWLYKKKIDSYKEMTNIKKELIERLEKDKPLEKIKLIKKQSNDDVFKYLFELSDGEKIESVVMKHNYGNSICISTQVGCNMGCLFCASGKLKKVRNLSASDMILQILFIEGDIKERISHVVLMGIGEPFDNYDNVLKFIRIINNNKGLDIGVRHITISTCGIIPKIEEFMKEGIQVNLAISLHASNDELRSRLMPINKVYSISKLISVVKKYINQTNRRVTFEYIMLKNINDSDDCAIELSTLLKGINCYVNLIPYNETDDKFKRTNKKQILHFYDILKKRGINVTIRREFGLEIAAACGQLRAEW